MIILSLRAVGRIVRIIATIAGGVLLCSGPGILIYQAYMWMKEGEWVNLPVRSLRLTWIDQLPAAPWEWWHESVNWLLDQPLGIVLTLLAALSLWAELSKRT